jgi:hypothetical protein
LTPVKEGLHWRQDKVTVRSTFKHLFCRQPRDPYGKYDLRKGRFNRWLSRKLRPVEQYIFGPALLIWIALTSIYFAAHISNYSVEPVIIIPHVEAKTDKLEAAKDKIVADLASCESKGVKEPDATIILDSNKQMSIGARQWQIQSIQHYVEQFEGHKISRVEAMQLATNHEQAKALTKRVIFEDSKGLANWQNCSNALSLAIKVELLKELSK